MFTPIGFFAAADAGPTFGGVTDGLAFMYEGAVHSDFTDTSGNGRTGTKSSESGGGIVHQTDGDGNYWLFNASSTADTNYVDSGFTPTAGNAFSAVAIVKWDTVGVNWGYYMVSDNATAGSQIDFWWRQSTGGTSTDLKQVAYINGSEFEPTYDASPTVTTNLWQMMTITFDGSNLKFYWNTTNYNTSAKSATISFPENIFINRTWNGGRGANSPEGWFGAIGFYDNKVLNASEISTNYSYFQNYYTGL